MASSAAAATAEGLQQNNFNPSWMRSTFHGGGGAGGGIAPSRTPMHEDDADIPLSKAILAKNRYGREDLLALVGDKGAAPPAGLEQCQFFTLHAQDPIVCTPFTEQENRLNQNINSSKAMSQLTRTSGVGGTTSSPNGPSASAVRPGGAWTPVKGNATSPAQRGGGMVPRGGPTRPYVPARGGYTGVSSEGDTNTYQSRFGTRGRGAPPTARGGSVTASGFNSRAQALYDPKDPKDRPRNRLRSTSEEAGDGWQTAGPKSWQQQAPPPAPENPWHRDAPAPVNAWGSSRTETNPSSTAWKSDSGSAMPEWMDEGDSADKRESIEEVSAGSFDEQGRFRAQVPNRHSEHLSHIEPSTVPQHVPDIAPNMAAHAPTTLPNAHIWATTQGQGSVPSTVPYDALQKPTVSQVGALGNFGLSGVRQDMAPPPALNRPPTPINFFYLDPQGNQQGPFTMEQMVAWFRLSYFSDTLEVRREFDSSYKKLGELKQVNGADTPFEFKEPRVVAPPPMAPQPVFSNSPLFMAGHGVWDNGVPFSGHNAINPMFDQQAEEKQREEETRRRMEEEMQAKSEAIARNMKKMAEEHERQIREREAALKEKEMRLEEERLLREKEQKDLEEKLQKLALIEKERERVQEEARRKEEAVKAEEERVRKDAERRDAERKEQEEKKRRAQEAAELHDKQMRLKAEEDAMKIRAQEAAKIKAKEEETRRRELQRKVDLEKNRAGFEIESAWDVAAKPKSVGVSSSSNSATSVDADEGGWITNASPEHKKKDTSKPKVAPWAATASAPVREKTLKEIQEEEERQLRAEQAELERLKKEMAKQQRQQPNLATSATWSNASQKLNWQQTKVASTAGAARGGMAWGGAGVDQKVVASTSPFWDGPSLAAANRAPPAAATAPTQKKTASAKPTPTPKANSKSRAATEESAKKALGMGGEDPLTKWVVSKLKGMQAAVDPEVLASFLEALENPNEVEDYVEGYVGKGKQSKEFVRDYLAKRCEMRQRKRAEQKDDLSSASGAPAAGSGQGKKNKNKGTRLVVDGSCLGFRATSDPNRTNQGEIETVSVAAAMRR